MTTDHRRRSSVNFGGKTFLPENISMKNIKMPEFYMIFARKIFSRIWGRQWAVGPRLLYAYARDFTSVHTQAITNRCLGKDLS